MNAETTLNKVREISENAYRRPGPNKLRMENGGSKMASPRRAIIPYEELHPLRIGGRTKTLKRKTKAPHVTLVAMQKDFMAAAVEKTLPEAA